MASFDTDPSTEDLSAWRARVLSKQTAHKSPEELRRAKAHSERQLRLQSAAKKGARLEKCSKMSRAAIAGSMLSFSAAEPEAESFNARAAGASPAFGFGGFGAAPAPAFGAAPAPSPAPAGGFSFGAAPPASGAAPAPFGATPRAAPSAQALFGASAAPQTKQQAVERARATKSALASLQRAALEEDDDAGDASLACAQQQLSAAGYAWAADESGGALDAVDDALGGADEARSASGLGALLAQLRVEPADDAERAAKFALYETHAEAVATVRSALDELWRECRDDFGAPGARGGARASVERALANIDARDNLGVVDDVRVWFVHAMAQAVSANETKISRVMRDVRAKLEMLAAQADCPICLEPLAASAAGGAPGVATTTLGCAHRVCGECWRNWSATCRAAHKAPYCPLCRQDEFIGDVMSGV